MGRGENLIESLAGLGVIPEGSLSQRVAVGERLMRDITFHPNDDQKRQVFASFLKFNAAELYAMNQRWPLTQRTLRRFLFGNGSDLDVTDTYFKSLKLREKWASPPGDEYETPVRHISNMLSGPLGARVLVSDGTDMSKWIAFPDTAKVVREKLKRGEPFELRFRATVIPPMDAADMKNSLNAHRMDVIGVADDIQRVDEYGKNPDREWSLTLKKPRVVISDTYDWDAQSGFGGAASPLRFGAYLLKEAGVEDPFGWIHDHMTQEQYNELSGTHVTIHDWEGALLVNNDVAHTFHVTGSLDVGGDLPLRIADKVLR